MLRTPTTTREERMILSYKGRIGLDEQGELRIV
jgi:hypothetical protein